MNKLYNILYFVFFFSNLAGSAQIPHINFTSLTSEEGFLSNSVNAIIKDRQGLMWFATDDGLNRFDGTNFKVYRNRRGDTASLRSNEILALHEDKKGNLWIGTSGGGLNLYNRRKDNFQHFPVNKNVAGFTRNTVIRSICSDHLGNIWIAQFDGLYVLDPGLNRISKLELSSGKNGAPIKTTLLSVFEDSKHRIWVATDDGLFYYTRETNTFRQFVHNEADTSSISSNKVRAIAEDRSGNIWVGTADGLCMLKPGHDGFVIYRHSPGEPNSPSNNFINCITADEDGLLWIGTNDGLNVFNPKNQTFTVYTPENGNIHSLTARSIRCAYIDQQGIYWFGTFRGGINKYDKNINLFNLIPSSAFKGKNAIVPIISAFAENINGNAFIGTDAEGLFEFDRKTKSIRRVPLLLNNQPARQIAVLALQKSRDNKLYIGTFSHGVIIMDLVTGSLQYLNAGRRPANMNSNDIFSLFEDSRGNIWAGTNGDGLHVIRKNKVIARYTPFPPSAANDYHLPVNGYIRAIMEDQQGNIWIGSHGGGLAVLHPDGKWTVYTKDNSSLPNDKIHALLCDSRGRIWVGTFGGGLSLYDKSNNQFITYAEEDGLQNTTIYQILEDLQGTIWFSTNTGISSFDLQQQKFRNFTSYNGVQPNNFVHASGIRLSNGELFFGGLQGFNFFNPQALTVNRNVPIVLLTDLKISNKSVLPGYDSPIKEPITVAKEIRLDYKQNFALSFVALNYSIPKQNQYAYKLEGFDKDWNYTGQLNTASYTNLDPGEYFFLVKASNNDGVWNKGETLIKIYVRPPFWRTVYAYIFYLLAIGGLLLYIRHRGITKLRKQFALEQEREQSRRLLELDRLKLKFLTNLSHDFRTPISLIMGPVDQLIHESGKAEQLDKLNMIRRNARRLLNLVNQLLDFRKMEEHELRLQLSKGDFISYVKEVSESFKDLSERKHINFVFTSNIERMDVLFDHDKIERILFNLLSNAFKFTLEGGTISVEIYKNALDNSDNNRVSIKVADTGIGIPKEKKDKIFERFFQHYPASAVLNQGTGIGLSITKEFVKMHGGEIEVESEPGQGTVFTIQLPLTPVEPAIEEKAELQAVETPDRLQQAADDEASMAVENNLTKPVSILLVEDNDDFRFYLKDNLRNSYQVLEAENGKEGWQKALASHPQLIVSDISMPEMDGISLVKKLKADKRTNHIPVILLTALTGDDQQVKGLETGANDYITKPFNFEVLNAKIKSLLELKSTLQSTYTKQIKVIGPEIDVTSSDEKLLQEIVTYLENNLSNTQLSVEGLSKHIGMSRSSLYTKLLQLTGETPVEYIRSFRLEKAAQLMQKSNMTISEIAYHVGFTTPNYFTKSFKSRFNMLPSEYISKMRKL
ncbi:hybrid sensor histidine kinase/response regulator transcription factor [Longitalea luteola]|uniref:hybrid sensor histidine kinase/response regulator transcription factor n=1 Tax=Longitalea luteola TaxID=2812563 RepID=UPI001A95C056|nr:hybrid sensor histidine kinase/response regulator transcription factor [Longitalea luteola]